MEAVRDINLEAVRKYGCGPEIKEAVVTLVVMAAFMFAGRWFFRLCSHVSF